MLDAGRLMLHTEGKMQSDKHPATSIKHHFKLLEHSGIHIN
jgi:hypothetical protein